MGIGGLNETPFHAALKTLVAPPGAGFEVEVDGYVVDAVADGVLIEVQTRQVGKMRRKLERLLERHRVRLVLPLPRELWIVRRAADGSTVGRRRSPKRAGMVDALAELVSVPGLLDHPRLEVEVVLVVAEEDREHRPGMAWRRRGWVVVGRRLLRVAERRSFRGARSWLGVLPERLPEPFDTLDLSHGAGVSRRVAQRAAYVLREAGVILPAAGPGRARRYVVASGD